MSCLGMDSSGPITLGAEHGGDVTAAERRFGKPKDGWLDLSTGINPCPYPHVGISPDRLARLPTSADLDGLLRAARHYYGAQSIVAAAGTQQLIQVLPSVLSGPRVSIAEPTYNEHARVWVAAGREIVDEGMPADIAVIVNPNNPDGRIHPLPQAATIIVDEAFCDVMPEATAIGRNAIVLRSFGKFFGLAGLRLGFAIASPTMVMRIAEVLGPWAVSGPAIEIGTRALSDARWIAENRSRLKGLRVRLDMVLEGAGLKIVGGTDLFRLVEDTTAPRLYDQLGRTGILVRAFSDHSMWLRFGLPGRDEDFARLAQALSIR